MQSRTRFQIAKFRSNSNLIEGSIYEDVDQDGHFNSAHDYGISFEPVLVLPDSEYYFSSTFGKYSASIDTAGKKIVQYKLTPGSTLTSDSLSYHFYPGISDSCCYDFGINKNFPTNLICDVTHAQEDSCNGKFGMWITIHNRGQAPYVGSSKLIRTSSYEFINCSETVDTVGNQINWPVDTIFPEEFFSSLLTFKMPDKTHIGDTIHFDYSYMDTTLTTICTHDLEFEYSCLWYNPFECEVFPGGIDSGHFVLDNTELEYTLHFVNNSNDIASRVVLVDTLDSNLNLSTFQVVASSHPVDIVIKKGGILVCTFNNILLPNSNTNSLKSQGFFKYSLKPKRTINLPVKVYNKADVYIGFNPSIKTGSVFNTVVSELPNDRNGNSIIQNINYYPNPVTTSLFIELPFAKKEICNITFFTIYGKEVKHLEETLPGNVNCDDLINGIYICKILSGDSLYYFKIIKI